MTSKTLYGYISNEPETYLDSKGRLNFVGAKDNRSLFDKIKQGIEQFGINAERRINRPTEDEAKQDTSTILALTTAPLGLGAKATTAIAKPLVKYTGNKIANMTAQGIGGGLVGGGIEGVGYGLVNDENPILTGLSGAGIGAVTGALGGLGIGKIAKRFDERALNNGTLNTRKFFDDYLMGTDKGNVGIQYDSLIDETLGNNLTETQAFKNWSGNTPMVSSKEALDYPFKTGQGVTVEGYHGTKRGDRVGAEFKKERATSGPMAFFSSDKDIATNYSKGKEDTSLSEEMMDYWQWFKYRDKDGNLKPLGDAWWDLSSDERLAVANNAPHISFDDEASNIILDQANNRGVGNYDFALKQYRNNPLKALIDGWLESGSLYGREDDFLKVLEKAGVNMNNIDYIDPYTDHSKVYNVYLSMKKPLVTNDIPNELVERLSAEAPNNPAKYQDGYGVDLWDKNRRDGVEWVNELKKDIAVGENSHAWTSIPDWVTEEMKKQGYDGIIDIGGKSGGEIHKVYIPFEPTQIKSVNNQGTFDPTNPNIYKSILAPIGAGSLFNMILNNKNDL
jgi:hypothetical protein